MTELERLWSGKTQEELLEALQQLSDYTEEGQRTILAELRRRGSDSVREAALGGTVCDMCERSLTRPDGYLFTTRQVVSNPAYWDYVFAHQLASIESDPGPDGGRKAAIAARQAGQRDPWLLCLDCAAQLTTDAAEAREHAKTWWDSGGRFTPPGSGPVPVGEVSFGSASEFSDTDVPKASHLYVLGRGFSPTGSHVTSAVLALCDLYEGLEPAHFKGAVALTRSVDAPNRPDFIDAIDAIRSRHPTGYAADAIVMDQETELDVICVAVWEAPASAEASRAVRRR
jgi:hypothetical protein